MIFFHKETNGSSSFFYFPVSKLKFESVIRVHSYLYFEGSNGQMHSWKSQLEFFQDIKRYIFWRKGNTCTSLCLPFCLFVSLSWKLTVGYKLCHFFIKLSNYIAYDNMVMMISCLDYICRSFVPFYSKILLIVLFFWQSIWGWHKCLPDNPSCVYLLLSTVSIVIINFMFV